MRRRLTSFAMATGLMVGLAACGEESTRQTQTTVARVGAPNYATLAPVPPTTTTTTLPPSETIAPSAAAAAAYPQGTETYRIQNNDSLSKIAGRYNITINELCRLNDFGDCPQTLLMVGREVVVPARDMAAIDEARAALFSGLPPSEDEPCPDGSRRRTYEITSADTSQTRAARRAGVELQLLEWINRGNPAWNKFVPGTRLLLPCDGEEWDDDFSVGITLDPDSTIV